jgi:hypothetical protein
MTLRHSYARGYKSAYEKVGLNPPTQVDEFIANIDGGKDVPPDQSTDKVDAPALPQDPAAALGTPSGIVPGV